MIDDQVIEFSKEWIKAIYSLKSVTTDGAMVNLQDLWDGIFSASYICNFGNNPGKSTEKELLSEQRFETGIEQN